jgi:hypothetical protein
MKNHFIHHPLNSEVQAIGGYYVFTKEVRLLIKEREIFYVTGCAAITNSCCGTAGCAFANVPGYILSWKERKDSNGLFISSFENITDPKIQNEIREIIKKREGINQVNFDL